MPICDKLTVGFRILRKTAAVGREIFHAPSIRAVLIQVHTHSDTVRAEPVEARFKPPYPLSAPSFDKLRTNGSVKN
jgi:hypothetical protein